MSRICCCLKVVRRAMGVKNRPRGAKRSHTPIVGQTRFFGATTTATRMDIYESERKKKVN